MKVTKNEAFRILMEHGLSPDQPTGIDPTTNEYIEESSFIGEFGEKPFYNLKKLYKWLGY